MGLGNVLLDDIFLMRVSLAFRDDECSQIVMCVSANNRFNPLVDGNLLEFRERRSFDFATSKIVQNASLLIFSNSTEGAQKAQNVLDATQSDLA